MCVVPKLVLLATRLDGPKGRGPHVSAMEKRLWLGQADLEHCPPHVDVTGMGCDLGPPVGAQGDAWRD